MTTLLAEEPLIVSLMLGAMGFGLLFAWLRNGAKPAAIAGLICLAIIPLAWVIAGRWETDREQIESLIYELANAVEQNDHESAVRALASPAMESLARAELQNWTFSVAKVTQIQKIRVFNDTYPPEADIKLVVKVRVSGKKDRVIQNVQIPRRLDLRMEKSGDQWLVTDYQHMPIVGGPDQFSKRGGIGQTPQGN